MCYRRMTPKIMGGKNISGVSYRRYDVSKRILRQSCIMRQQERMAGEFSPVKREPQEAPQWALFSGRTVLSAPNVLPGFCGTLSCQFIEYFRMICEETVEGRPPHTKYPGRLCFFTSGFLKSLSDAVHMELS